jgi:RIO-like serine/threonine protein kinase
MSSSPKAWRHVICAIFATKHASISACDRFKVFTCRCCGIVGLRVPYLYDNAELTHLLFMSWASRSVLSMIKVGAISNSLRDCFVHQKEMAIAALAKLHVQHGDLEERNMTYDNRTDRLMVIDFERSSPCTRRDRYRAHESTRSLPKLALAVSLDVD